MVFSWKIYSNIHFIIYNYDFLHLQKQFIKQNIYNNYYEMFSAKSL